MNYNQAVSVFIMTYVVAYFLFGLCLGRIIAVDFVNVRNVMFFGLGSRVIVAFLVTISFMFWNM